MKERPIFTLMKQTDVQHMQMPRWLLSDPRYADMSLDACELSYFEPETARVFENAIERLFYSDSFRIGKAVLPQSRVLLRGRCGFR